MVAFSGLKIVYRCQCLFASILNYYQRNQMITYCFHPNYILNTYSSSTKSLMTPRRSHSCEKKSGRWGLDISFLLAELFSPAKKIKLCYLGIIYNTMLSVLEIKYFIILSYPRTTYLCKRPARLALILPSGCPSRFAIPLVMIFTLTSCIGRATSVLREQQHVQHRHPGES
jgi:hypothetical protein